MTLIYQSALGLITALLTLLFSSYLTNSNRNRDYKNLLSLVDYFNETDNKELKEIIDSKIKEEFFKNEFGITLNNNEDIPIWNSIKNKSNISWMELKKANSFGLVFIKNNNLEHKLTLNQVGSIIFFSILCISSVFMFFLSIYKNNYVALGLSTLMFLIILFQLFSFRDKFLLFNKIKSNNKLVSN